MIIFWDIIHVTGLKMAHKHILLGPKGQIFSPVCKFFSYDMVSVVSLSCPSIPLRTNKLTKRQNDQTNKYEQTWLTPAELRKEYKSFLTINWRAGDVASVWVVRLLFLRLPRDTPVLDFLFSVTSSLFVATIPGSSLLVAVVVDWSMVTAECRSSVSREATGTSTTLTCSSPSLSACHMHVTCKSNTAYDMLIIHVPVTHKLQHNNIVVWYSTTNLFFSVIS